MPQTLHRFGLDTSEPTKKLSTPTPILTAAEITIFWASWCDLVYTTRSQPNTTPSITYIGTSLTSLQLQEFTTLTTSLRQSLLNPKCRLTFFGSAMHHGVRGYMTRTDYSSDVLWDKDCENTVFIFNTEVETRTLPFNFEEESWAIPPPFHHHIAEVRVCSDESLLMSFKVGKDENAVEEDREEEGEGCIVRYKDMSGLREYCKAGVEGETLVDFPPVQFVTNATTSTVICPDNLVHTQTTDPRYPSTLGRPHTGNHFFEPVPYLSETRASKIASGGYMTAVISEEGELFLWGQANPGTNGELAVLRLDNGVAGEEERETAIWVDDEQDEYVKCLSIRVDGKEAVAYDVAVGFGHVLVAAKSSNGMHVVFAAGCGSEGQLGLGRSVDFQEEFEEIVALRNKRVIQLEAAGWSSFVVTDNDEVGSDAESEKE